MTNVCAPEQSDGSNSPDVHGEAGRFEAKEFEDHRKPESFVVDRADTPLAQMDEETTAHLLAVIQQAVRKTMRVGLQKGDGSQRNQDALELVNEAWVRLQSRLLKMPPVLSPKAYAFLTARKVCFDYLRSVSAQRRSLCDSALRFLRITPEFAAWKVDGKWLTGFESWRTEYRRRISSDSLMQLLASNASLSGSRLRTLHWSAYKRSDWRQLFLSVFRFADAPIWLDDLLAVIVQITDAPQLKHVKLADVDSGQPLPDAQLDSQEELKATWQEITALPRQQRVALLLNSVDGGLDQFVFTGVATLQELAATLALTVGEFAILRRTIPAFGAECSDTATLSLDEQFAALWRHVPIGDDGIATMLGLRRQEVVNRRLAARQRLYRRLLRTIGHRRQKRNRHTYSHLNRAEGVAA